MKPSKVSKNVNPTNHPKVTLKEVTQTHLYSGPIPDPHSLQQYENINPGFADRLIAMAEKEQNERHSNQKELLKSEKELAVKELSNIRRGQWLALCSAWECNINCVKRDLALA